MSNQKYAWVITNDFTTEDQSLINTCGPKNNVMCKSGIVSNQKASLFRLLDDDNEIYCTGYFLSLHDSCSGFEPLDDFGTPSLGCTQIEYWNVKDKIWETL